jgi:dihydrofolate reductase
MLVSLVVAMSENRVIGRDNKLPWHLPADLKYFKELTTGHVVIMGRKTFESIGSKPLPKRPTVVVTRDWALSPGEEVRVAHSLADALREALEMKGGPDAEIFVLGGSQIFRQAILVADRLYVTLVHAEIEGDVSFPEFDLSQWKLISDQRREADEKNQYPMSFRVYERVRTISAPPSESLAT